MVSVYNENVAFGQQLVAQTGEDVIFSVPCGLHLYVLNKCKDVKKAFFYLSKTVEHRPLIEYLSSYF